MEGEQIQVIQTMPSDYSFTEVGIASAALIIAYTCVKLVSKVVTNRMYGRDNGRTDRRTGATADTIMTKLTSVENMVRDIHKKD